MLTVALILAALGLPESATEQDFTNFAVKAKRDEASSQGSAKLLTALGAKTPDEALGTVAALQASRDNAVTLDPSALLVALGVTSIDEGVGVVEALKSAKDRAEKAEAELVALGKTKEDDERTKIIAKLDEDGKCSLAQKESLFPNLTLAGLKAYAATAVPFMKGDGKKESRSGAKSYADMTNLERHALAQSDPALFEQLRSEHEKAAQ